MTKLLSNARMDLNGKKLANLSCTCSPELKERVDQYQSDFGIETRSAAIETILREFFLREDIGPLGHISDVENGTLDLHRLTSEIFVAGDPTPLQRQRWTKKMSDLFYRMWNEEHDIKEGVA